MEKYICIHGHFYQPPRENPWLEEVELQDSAWPYHDWNERITAECYGPNATARMLDGESRIDRIVNNYSKISFNFGPTLLSWMKTRIPEIHDAIIVADRESQKNFSGHGSALAQVYNHMILPLGNTRDKQTQVLWGYRDFEYRFGRKPEGMWLAETAVDTPTLEVLAERGIKFTILSPFQANRVRRLKTGRHWRDVNGGRIDPTMPYAIRLPSGRQLTVFFYDAPVSQAVAFEGLLQKGERLGERLVTAFSDRRQWDQLVNIATDGESYGHHHRYGEMALAYALQHIESNNLARLTNYGEFLDKHPPTHEVQVHEKSAWSCSHGVGRWMANCGCNSGGRAGWHQEWRAPLRHALDWLRDELIPLFEGKCGELLKEPWTARNDYIYLILDRSADNREKFFSRHASRELGEQERIVVLKLMELQRHAMLMYTSCGWFFDEISGIESVQVLQYAARAIQLAKDILGADLEPGFLELLAHAKSNIPEHSDGRAVYNKFVKPSMVEWETAVAHYAISSLFRNYSERTGIFVYQFDDEDRQEFAAGKAKLVVGRAKVSFEVTRETAVLSYAVIYLGEHNLTGGIQRYAHAEQYDSMKRELKAAFDRADFPETIRLIDRHFGASNYSLKSLFKDEQRKVVSQILISTDEDLENRFRLIAERYTPLMHFLKDLGVPLPSALQMARELVLNRDIRREIESDRADLDRLASLLQEARERNVQLDQSSLSFLVKNRLESLLQQLAANPTDLAFLEYVEALAIIVSSLSLDLNLWKVQNICYEMTQQVLPGRFQEADQGDENAKAWVQHFRSLASQLGFGKGPLKA
jgi:alpha-amylase/alpha-mannosidase (GH57 family)